MDGIKDVAPLAERRDIITLERIPLRCTCGKCTAPFGYLIQTPCGYVIVIESQHHGKTHLNTVPLVNAQIVAPTKECAPGEKDKNWQTDYSQEEGKEKLIEL